MSPSCGLVPLSLRWCSKSYVICLFAKNVAKDDDPRVLNALCVAFGCQPSLDVASSHHRTAMSLGVCVPRSAYNLVVSVYSLAGFWAVRTRVKPGPRLTGVRLLGMPVAKSGIAGEAGGVYTGNEVN